MNPPLLEIEDVSKAFFGVPVLQKVSLALDAGRTLGLVGENGAGKSTLMNLIGGILKPDSGFMRLSGQVYAPRTPRDAEAAGVAFIHQELNLFSNLSIAENIFLTHFPRRGLGRLDRQAMFRRSQELLRQVGLEVSPNLRVEELSAGERQLVEIAKALQRSPRLIIWDEPTTSLTARETSRLFAMLERLRESGIAMIYISHALGDIQHLCDEVLVLRDGMVVGQGAISGFAVDRMVALMVGRERGNQFPPRTSQPSSEIMLEARDVSQPGVVHEISFAIHRSEVLGVSGLMGSGRTELARILFGLDPMAGGVIELCQQPIEALSTASRIARGLALLTESRRDDGLCMHASIHDNMSLVAEPKFASRFGGLLRKSRLASAVRNMRQAVKLSSAANLRNPVQTLSGGNQQKVVLAKWLLNEPKVLILDEPTRGIDVGAKYEIYSLIDQLAASGAAILVISSEIEELLGLCDRILVMSQGEIRDELSRSEFDENRIMRASLQVSRRTGTSS